MRVIEIEDQQLWDFFISKTALDSGFLQSWVWGDFQKSVGRKIWRLGVMAEGTGSLLGAALVVKHLLPFGKSYFYIPRGPMIQSGIFETLLEKIQPLARQEGAIFLRLDPPLPNHEEHMALLRNLGFIKSRREVQPRNTLIIDLSKTEEELLRVMHEKTRYNIRLAERKGVRIENVQCPISNVQFNIFWDLLRETAKRDGFHAHPREYYEKLILTPPAPSYNKRGLGGVNVPGQSVELFFASYQGQVLAVSMVGFYNGWAIYLHGASSGAHREVMAPHLLHWRIMQEAKRRGCIHYDLWGVSPINSDPNDPNHPNNLNNPSPWAGLTRFKSGFAPETPTTSYVGTWDLPLSSVWYKAYAWAEKVKRAIGR